MCVVRSEGLAAIGEAHCFAGQWTCICKLSHRGKMQSRYTWRQLFFCGQKKSCLRRDL